ncbi:hypothetical protein NL676_005184 [Syzygium grande]|nr:hypothetical protein NL676_005184 [Syzygium grande]
MSRDDHFTSSTSRGNISIEDIGNIGDDINEYDLFESEHFGSQSTKSQLDLYLEENRLDRKKYADLNRPSCALEIGYLEFRLRKNWMRSLSSSTFKTVCIRLKIGCWVIMRKYTKSYTFPQDSCMQMVYHHGGHNLAMDEGFNNAFSPGGGRGVAGEQVGI